MTNPRPIIIALLVFNGLTAVAGGVGLASGSVAPPVSYLEHSFFDSFLIPGIILGLAGFSALAGAAMVIRGLPSAKVWTAASGWLMLAWIIGEIISIRTFNWMQVIYLATGGAVILMPNRAYLPHGKKTPDIRGEKGIEL